MASAVKIFGIAGSLRAGSYNHKLIETAAELLPEGASLDIFDRLGEIPLFNQDNENEPAPAVVDLKARIRAADAVLFVTPEYNYSIPGVLKNAIDAASRPHGDSAWQGKPAAIMGVSVGRLGTIRAQNHLRGVLVFLNMPAVLQPEVLVNHAESFDESGNITNDKARELIGRLLHELVAFTRQLRGEPRESAAAG
jgi:chromate reductase